MNSQRLKFRGLINDLPAIVLEAGGGSTSKDWVVLQRCLAERTLTVSYDRVEQTMADTYRRPRSRHWEAPRRTTVDAVTNPRIRV